MRAGGASLDGVGVGHVTLDGTGVTCVLLPPETVGSCEVRGGAPASRETALLDPLRTVAQVDAIVLTGGSAFGLAAADGVMAHLASVGRGYPTAGGPVPIVPTLAVFDLPSPHGPPTPTDGRAAAVPGGVGAAVARSDDGVALLAVAVVNAVGDVVGDDGRILAGSRAPSDAPAFPSAQPFEEAAGPTNTTIVALVTDAALDKLACALLAQHAHDGLARALRPSHTRYDGDAVVTAATGRARVEPDAVSLDRVLHWGALTTAAAIRAAVSAPRAVVLDLQ